MTETLTRDELHDRINKANFDPADVIVVGYMDTRPPPPPSVDVLFGLPADMYELLVEDFKAQRAEWVARNVELFGREFPGSRCEHCGNSIRWAAIVQYVPTGQHFVVGEVCADERMSLASRADHDMRLVKMAAEHRAEMARRAEARATFYREHPVEAAYLFNPDRAADGFIDNLARKVGIYGELSEKQLACVTRNIEREAEWDKRKAEEAAKLVDTPPIENGRREVTGTVRSIKWQDNDFGGSFKMLVELEDGNKVWGTLPASLKGHDFNTGHDDLGADTDDRVRFTATIERSTDDEHFGFFKRPTKATIIEEATP